jgi:hypothetical protein
MVQARNPGTLLPLLGLILGVAKMGLNSDTPLRLFLQASMLSSDGDKQDDTESNEVDYDSFFIPLSTNPSST